MKRFWDKVAIREEDECWPWLAGAYSDGQYGAFYYGKRMQRAHRVVWELTNGNIPSDMNVLHKCHNTMCVNPNHLYLGTQKENVRDTEQAGRGNHLRQGSGVSKFRSKWRARIWIHGKEHYIGVFNTREEALQAYQDVLEGL